MTVLVLTLNAGSSSVKFAAFSLQHESLDLLASGQIEGLDPDRSCFAMGQSAGGVRSVMKVADLVDQIMAEAHATLDRMARLNAASPARPPAAAAH